MALAFLDRRPSLRKSSGSSNLGTIEPVLRGVVFFWSLGESGVDCLDVSGVERLESEVGGDRLMGLGVDSDAACPILPSSEEEESSSGVISSNISWISSSCDFTETVEALELFKFSLSSAGLSSANPGGGRTISTGLKTKSDFGGV